MSKTTFIFVILFSTTSKNDGSHFAKSTNFSAKQQLAKNNVMNELWTRKRSTNRVSTSSTFGSYGTSSNSSSRGLGNPNVSRRPFHNNPSPQKARKVVEVGLSASRILRQTARPIVFEFLPNCYRTSTVREESCHWRWIMVSLQIHQKKHLRISLQLGDYLKQHLLSLSDLRFQNFYWISLDERQQWRILNRSCKRQFNINSDDYLVQSVRLHAAIQTKRPCKKNQIVFHYDNTRSHVERRVKEFIASKWRNKLPQPPYSLTDAAMNHHVNRSLKNWLANEVYNDFNELVADVKASKNLLCRLNWPPAKQIGSSNWIMH